VSAIVVTVNHRRIGRARTWLESRVVAEEVLIIGASLDAANELARRVAEEKGAAFGWHRVTLPQLVAALAAPLLAKRKLVPLSRLGAEAIVARVVHRLKAEAGLGRYQPVGGAPPQATARGDRWVVPDPGLVPQFTTDAADEPIISAETDIPTSDSGEPPSLEGQLRAPRRWERLLVEAAVIGGRDRWRRRIDGLANDLRLRLAEIGEGDEALARTLGLCRKLFRLDSADRSCRTFKKSYKKN
jgi:hypothetical protein